MPRVIAHYMHEQEMGAALNLIVEAELTEAYVVGEADEVFQGAQFHKYPL